METGDQILPICKSIYIIIHCKEFSNSVSFVSCLEINHQRTRHLLQHSKIQHFDIKINLQQLRSTKPYIKIDDNKNLYLILE